MGVGNFIWCLLTGVAAVLAIFGGLMVIVALVAIPVSGLDALAKTRPWLKRVEIAVGYTLLSVLGALFVAIGSIGLHDWGCEIHHHPEHKVWKDKTEHTEHK